MMPSNVIGTTYLFNFGDQAKYRLTTASPKVLRSEVVADSRLPAGTVNDFQIDRVELRPGLYLLSWTEPESGNTVTQVQDFAEHTAYVYITDRASSSLWCLKGTITERGAGATESRTREGS